MDIPETKVSMLVVEDEAITLEYLFQALSRKYPRYLLLKALDGTTGLELFRTHLPDIVITDITMPGIDGIQMSREMRRIKKDTKFILLSGVLDEGILKDLNKSGVLIDHFIDKPILYKDLFDAIEKCAASSGH